MAQNPLILHCVPALHPRHGGPSRTVVALTDALARVGDVTVQLLSQRRAGEPVVDSGPEVRRSLAETGSGIDLALGVPLRRALLRLGPLERPRLVHTHGLWHPASHWAARAARGWRVPLVLHPRGMLEPWALEQKWLKKRVALALFQRHDLDSVRVLVTTSCMEYENLRAFGLRQPVAVIPNGVVLPQRAKTVYRKQLVNRERTMLFLSRVHPKKGLLELVEAWGRVRPAGWRLLIAGPDEGGHWGEVRRRVDSLGVGGSVTYVGQVDGEGASALYRQADVFVLPSYSENFGVVVAEALAHGLPVITTRATPWDALMVKNCGWWIDTGVSPLIDAITEAVMLSDSEREGMGQHGVNLARQFSWEHIAQQTLEVYRWLLGSGSKPSCVSEE